MDLDFSFALVSSLTPRRKGETSGPAGNLKKTKSLKTKLNLPLKSQNPEEISHQKREEKENIIPEEQLMNKDEFLELAVHKRNSDSPKNNQRRRSSDKMLSSLAINMENISVRKTRTRGRKKIYTSPVQPLNNVETSDAIVVEPSSSNEKIPLIAPEIINISSDIDDSFNKTKSNENKGKSKNRPSRLTDSSIRSSLEIVDSSCSEVNGDSIDSEKHNRRCLRSSASKKPNVTSGVSETSLSTAYDSDSFQARHRPGTRVIPETPETDKSAGESFNAKGRSSGLYISSEENKETYSLSSCINESPIKSLNGKRKSSEISASPDENKKRCSIESLHSDIRPKRKSSLLSCTSEKTKQISELGMCLADSSNRHNQLETNTACKPIFCEPTLPINRNTAKGRLKKKLRTSIDSSKLDMFKSNDSSELDMFKLESRIKDQSFSSDTKKEFSNRRIQSTTSFSNSEQQASSNSLVCKGRNTKQRDSKTSDLDDKIRNEEKKLTDMKKISKKTIGNGNLKKTKSKQCSPVSPIKSTLVLPSEVIPKFEHINQWLKNTQENTIGSLGTSAAVANGVSVKDIIPVKNKYKVSLSPRIKKRKDKAKSSLEEEQKIFEELYGADYNKRLSDDVDEVTSRTSCQDSVEFSENVLDKLYGTVWQNTAAGTQSEPRKGKDKNSKSKTPLTERKKHRTSIYEVFSSSSSEDRFEEFLENVHRGKVKTSKRRSGRRTTPEFINDSDSEDNTSIVFYQNIVSSAVKDEVSNIRREEIKSGQDTHRVNRRRLSFGSSKDGGSESGKSDTKPRSKSKKTSNNDKKSKTKTSRSKKKENKDIEGKGSKDIDVFSLVTPLKIKGKEAENDFSERVTNRVTPTVPTSTGKPKTPKTTTRQNNHSNSEERLKATYLKECDFKVPKSALKTFKTPSKTSKPQVPSSPALSFLSSLSEMTAGLPCHPDALAYKKTFKSKREELTKRLFTLYNKEVFDNQLPADMLIQWSTRMTSTSGYCYNKRMYRDNQILRSSRILLSTKILDRADRLRDTLIHELCHAATWIVHATSDGHGPIWRSWADKANRRFPELPVIKRCHDYAISTKFTYKCMSCGYSIGRHTKSLDTERKRCGYCFGKFEVFVTAKMSSASATSGSGSVKTPRNPTGFALFVKENYAIVKRENNVPHAQVMKLLSQKFAEVKISKQNAEEPILIE